uniref:Uncharacterized protein n=1 Tax=Entamoeba invadens TaxID=33085 RepID=S0B3P9_ENTIV|nr:hypothetical protein [Entamoeba invadens]
MGVGSGLLIINPVSSDTKVYFRDTDEPFYVDEDLSDSDVEDESDSKRVHRTKKSTVQAKERKRNNRVNANRNDYGNEGFLLMLCYYLGCAITLTKLQKKGKNQKLKIVEITYDENVLVSRTEIEKKVELFDFPKNADKKREKRTIISTTVDNLILDVLKYFFGLVFDEEVKKKPKKDYIPERRTLEKIELQKTWDKKSLIDEGVKFYENVKTYGDNKEWIHLSKNEIDQQLMKGVQPKAPEYTYTPSISNEQNTLVDYSIKTENVEVKSEKSELVFEKVKSEKSETVESML